MSTIIYTGQNVAKDCIVGDVQTNRYSVFNGLELPRRIGPSLEVTLLGVQAGTKPTTAATSASAGALTAGKYYGWVAVYASNRYTRPVAALDGSVNMTRGNPSEAITFLVTDGTKAVDVTVPTISQAGITHVLLYRSIANTTATEAAAGPFFYVGQSANTGASVTITDAASDTDLGGLPSVELDNDPPNAYRYAVDVRGTIFAGGNFQLGLVNSCTVTPGSSTVTLDSDILYDGVRGWKFRCTADTTGGTEGSGLFYANYVDAHTLKLVDETGAEKLYDGSLSGAGQAFVLYLPGNVLCWSKPHEPEAWPILNSIDFEGNITGLIQIPNQSLLLVCTDKPSMVVLDINLIGTQSFGANQRIISQTFSATSHYSLVTVEGAVRGIDATLGCVFEVTGIVIQDITKSVVPKIWKYLAQNLSLIRNWHCAYDQKQKLFAAFVTFQNSQRMVDFCIGQNVITGSWFFNWEKDLLCSGTYRDPNTGEFMVLGGTQGFTDSGAVWGRLWSPDVFDEWFPGGLKSGTITASTGPLSFTVDHSVTDLHTDDTGLKGRWVLVTDANGEHEQLGYILSNTAGEITLSTVVQGSSVPSTLDPLPASGWKFYVGLIECRWGPKLFDFGDPDVRKKVQEVWACTVGHDPANLPIIRLYRGFDTPYAEQLQLAERTYLDKGGTQTLANQTSAKLEPTMRWGISFIDRSYGATTLRSLTFVYLPQVTTPAGVVRSKA